MLYEVITGAIPLVVAAAQKSAILGRPVQACYVRKEQKERGAEKLLCQIPASMLGTQFMRNNFV